MICCLSFLQKLLSVDAAAGGVVRVVVVVVRVVGVVDPVRPVVLVVQWGDMRRVVH